MTKEGKRERSLRVPMFDDELAMLHALVEATGLSAASIVRTAIRAEYQKRFGTKKHKR